MKKNSVVGVNGFGRFGLHLMKFYIDNFKTCNYEIKYINDDTLNIDEVFNIILNDKYVNFNKIKVLKEGDYLSFLQPDGYSHKILYSNNSSKEIPWTGDVDYFFECSGKHTIKKSSLKFLKGKTKRVIISATSWDCDSTLVYGFNHKNLNDSDKIISYGSCTVNAYVPLANYFNSKYGIIESDVNVIHNIQEYRLMDNYTLNRKFCTLEKSGVNMLPFLKDKFNVNYTVIPYDGISTIDFRFKMDKSMNKDKFIAELKESINNGELKDLYGIDKADIGPEVYNCTRFSTVFIEDSIKVLNNNVYLFGYFDNENSVNRYFDLTKYIVSQDSK
tara:strand:+ start:801 stop:1793 length:993 start_codon:yes stop_codon:yes gene_type:complete